MYLPVPFPSDVAPKPSGGPSWSTGVSTTLVGDEQRNQNWLRSRHSFEMSQGIKTAEQFKAIGKHFRNARGKLHKFRTRDWSDYICTREEGALLPLTATTFQLTKVYGDEVGFLEERRITRPIASTLQVWKDNVLQTLTTHYTLAADGEEGAGVVTFTSPPGAAVLECAFGFDVPCRYDVDQLKSTLVFLNEDGDENAQSLISWEQVPLVEVREA